MSRDKMRQVARDVANSILSGECDIGEVLDVMPNLGLTHDEQWYVMLQIEALTGEVVELI